MAAEGGTENVIFRAINRYVPKDRVSGLTFEKDCLFVLLNTHDMGPPRRRKLFFVSDVAGNYGFVPKNQVKDRQESPPVRSMGVVIEDHEPVEEQELRLRVGDIVNITDKSPTGWYNGSCNGRQGWFSKEYVKETVTFEDDAALTYQFTVQALNSNLPVTQEDLPFSAFEYLDILKRPNTTDTYWIGRNKFGKIGKIPKDRIDERPDLRSVLQELPWFYDDCTREQALALLDNVVNTPNHFLFRHASQPGDFAATVTCGQNSLPLNVRIYTSITGYEVSGRNFESLEEIKNHYSTHPINIENDDKNNTTRQIFLHHPVQCTAEAKQFSGGYRF